MDFHQDSQLILSVSLGKDKRWHVTEQDAYHPLASFDNPLAACAWAVARATSKGGRILVEEQVTSTQALLHESMNAPNIFKFSIPVTWTESGYSRFKYARNQPHLSRAARHRN